MTEKIETKSALNTSEVQEIIFKELYENATVGIYRTTPDGKFIFANPAAVALFGYSSQGELLQVNVEQGFYNPEERKKFQSILAREDTIYGFEIKWKRGDGLVIDIRDSARAIKDEEGNVIYYEGVVEDITEKKKAERELIRAKDEAEEMSRLKSNFLANMSHELRTPLSGILGYAEMLKEEIADSFHIELIEGIQQSGTRLLKTLNSLLNFSLLESGKIKPNHVALNIPAAILSLVNAYSNEAKKKNLEIETGLMPDVLKIDIDENIFNQILSNLVENAIKYTNEGKILIKVDLEANNDKHRLVIKVSDTGIGIPSEIQNHIFEPFRQGSEGASRSFEGSGLGLTITKKYVELMNGEIFLESTPGSGSTFSLKFPLGNGQLPKAQDNKQASHDETVACNLPKILLVENEISNVDITRHFLKDMCKVDDVNNGRDALLLLIENKYDAILMDIDLPGSMDGMEITHEARKLPAYKETPIIALTAFAMKGDKEKFINAGCSHYMPKPFKREELRELMKSLLIDRKRIK